MRFHYPIELARESEAVRRGAAIAKKHARITPLALAWLAGLLEGEGSFSFLCDSRRGKSPYFYARVSVSMTDEDVIVHAADLMGCTVQRLKTPTKGGKPIYRAVAKGKRAVSLMVLLLPYMGTRRSAMIRDVLNRVPAIQHVHVANLDNGYRLHQMSF